MAATTDKPRYKHSRALYKPEDIERGLTALAIYGNSEKAVAALKANGLTAPSSRQLQNWRDQYPEQWNKAVREQAPKIEQQIVGDLLTTLQVSQRTVQVAVNKTLEQLEAGEAKDPAGAARNIATVVGITTDKFLTLTGRPSQIVENRTADQLLASIGRLVGATPVVDTTAEEISEATEISR